MSADDYIAVTCPMPGCGQPLFVNYSCQYGIYAGELADPDSPNVHPADGASQSWSVNCTEGHVLLLPREPGCDCDDPDGDGCPPEHQDDYDWSDEYRVFRAIDWTRLADIVAVIRTSAETTS